MYTSEDVEMLVQAELLRDTLDVFLEGGYVHE